MSKKWSISLLVLMLFAGLITVAPAALADEVVTLSVLNYFDATSPGAEREREEIWAEFERRNPNIRLEREDLFLEPFHQKTEAYAAAGSLPDVLLLWPGGRSSTLHTQGLMKDLAPFVEDMRDEFIEGALDPQAGGYLAMIPMGVTATHVMYVNEPLLEELGLEMPETYEDLVAMVEPLRAAGKEVVLMGAQDDWVIQSTLFSMIVGRLLGNEYMDQLVAGEADFTDEPFVGALAFYRQMYDDGVLSRRIMQTAYGEVNGLFAQGRAPFLIDGDWKVANFITDPSTGQALISPEDQENIKLTVFPAIPGEVNSGTTATVVSTGYGMSAAIPEGSAKEEAAWKLLEWLASEEVQRVRLETGARASRIGVTSDQLEPIITNRADFYAQMSGTYVIDNVLPSAVYGPLNVGLQEIGLGFSTPEEVAARVQRAYEDWAAAQ